MMDLEQFKDQYKDCYHKIRLPSGIILGGEYDMSRYIHYYKLPQDMKGMTVLDVGCSAGFFSLEMAYRGATVVGVDLWEANPLFIYMAEHFGLKLSYESANLIDKTFLDGRKYDFVFCSNVICHVLDPMLALRNLHGVCGGKLIISTMMHPRGNLELDSKLDHKPVAFFLGEHVNDYDNGWIYTTTCFSKMITASGFRDVRIVSRYLCHTGSNVNGGNHIGVFLASK
ncbi:MAG: class I SAM-dependent methyltransferase [Methanomassiliicoccales archaeon]|jgi:tRNA (mo5U34)-methyltransferase